MRRQSSAVGDSVAVKSAARAAIVMPAVFAFADKLIGQPQTSLFAAFGSFALLVLVEFTGPPRTRLAAYLALACVGVAFITLGTLCSRHAWLAAGAMAVVGFATLFAGVINGYFAAAATGALLTFVLPVTLPAPNSAIPERLEGWGLAAGAGISALMLVWPPRQRANLQREAAGALRAVADHLDADRESWAERARAARASVDALGRRLLGQHRPTGPTGPMAALASLPDELDWLLSFLTPAPEVQLELACAEDAEALAAAAQVLRASAETLQGLNGQPDFQRLEAARDAVARALMRRLPELSADIRVGEVPRALDAPFRIRALTYAARQAAAYGLLASGTEVPELDHLDVAQPPAALAALEATERLTIEHASVRSVWFRNSLRGAVGLAVAVYIAQRTGLQHGFWVVLGTLSVLRSNALGTGWSIVSALAGTAVGIVLGAVLVIGIGTHEAVLWGVLPVAVFLAAYAPRAISFAAGQAGFTVVLFVLFNIIQPVGWSVGLVRFEDVAIGFAISLLVGLLFWPRGAAALLLDELATAYARGADFVLATARRLSEEGSDEAARAGRASDAALHRLDDAFRQYLAERSATAYNVEDVAALVGGAARVRRAALSLAALARMTDGKKRLEHCARNLDGELQALQAWYIAFGSALTKRRQVPPPHIRDTEGRSRLLTCVRDAARGRDKATVDAALVLLWSSQHLDNLWRLESRLAERADAARAAATAAE
ncbi:MAG: hypothetical protein AUG48_10465 [Actinobacteria bacterium 13_1_20CM_3_68_9]|nr:MAG: hypothetical protein AUG48_10465 [Actinobacteria bacterium 13_1_20CM_3_68_9]